MKTKINTNVNKNSQYKEKMSKNFLRINKGEIFHLFDSTKQQQCTSNFEWLSEYFYYPQFPSCCKKGT